MNGGRWKTILQPTGLSRSVLTLVSGTTAALGLAYAVRPILTRLYTPEDFGLLGFFVSLVAFLSAGATARFCDAIMLPSDRRSARGLLRLATFATLATTVACLPFAIWRDGVAALFGEAAVAPYLILVPLAVAVTAGSRIVERWLARERRFRALSGLRVAGAGVRVPVQLAGGLSGNAWGLIAAVVVDRILWPLFLAVDTMRNRPKKSAASGARLRLLARRYRRFPLYSTPAGVLSSGSSQLPALLLLYFFDARVVGFYSQSYGLLAVPIALLGGSVGQVYFAHAAERHRKGTLGPLTESVFRRLILLGLFPTLALVAVGPDLVAFVLGEAFREAGVYARLLAPALLFVFASSPLSSLFDILERQRENLLFNGSVFAGRVAALLVGGLAGDARLTIGLFGATSAVLWAVHTVWMVKLGDVSIRHAGGLVLRYAACAVVPFSLLMLPVVRTASPFLVTAGAVGTTLLYYGLAFYADARYPPTETSAETDLTPPG